MSGCHVAFAESVDKVVENIAEVRPTLMVSVPRLFEKIYSRIYENAHQLSPAKRRLFHWAVETGRQYVAQVEIAGKPAASLLRLRHGMADKLVFAKIRQRFGGRLKSCISGGAPLDRKINEFMWILGIAIYEGYGLTESSPALTLSAPGSVRFGSVGRALEQTELKLAADGELLARGPQVMRGYYRDEAATAEVLHGRLAGDRRHRPHRRGGLRLHRRSQEGDHRHRRRQEYRPATAGKRAEAR